MASNNRAPKQWALTSNETLNSFKNWKANLEFTLSLDSSFKPFLKDGVTWEMQTSLNPSRGFTDDAADVANGQKKEEKVAALNLMLGLIANWATVISRSQIIERSTSLNNIWNTLRQHYGFHVTGSRFLDLHSIKLSAGERPEDLFQKLVSFIDDSLLTTDCGLTHHSAKVEKNEEMSPTLENVIVALWLERLHVNLPALVKQRYGSELRNKTLASIKPEISQALSSLLEELSSGEDSRIMRAQTFSSRRGGGQSGFNNNSQQNRPSKYCCLCRTANRPGYDSHYLTQCRFLPESDRRRLTSAPSARIRAVDVAEADNGYDENYDHDPHSSNQNNEYPSEFDNQHDAYPPALYDDNFMPSRSSQQMIPFNPIQRRIPSLASVHRRVTTRKSPILQCFYRHIPISLCLDTGAESNLISRSIAKFMNLAFSKTTQGALQADEKTPLAVIGEVTGIKISKGAYVFTLDALIVEEEIGYIVAGEPFLEVNDIAVRPAKRIIIIQGRETIPYAANF